MKQIALVAILVLAGCLGEAPESKPEENPTEARGFDAPAVNETDGPLVWFGKDENGAPGNRHSFSMSAGVAAWDAVKSPYKIHVRTGPDYETKDDFAPGVEPLNLVSAQGPRGPVVAYRGPDYSVYVAERIDGTWVTGSRIIGSGEVVGFPVLVGNQDHVILGLPISAGASSRFELISFAEGVPKNLNDAPSMSWPADDLLILGDVAIQGDEIAVAFARAIHVEYRRGTWQTLATATATTFDGPSAGTQSRAPSLAFLNESVILSITAWELIGGTNPGNRDVLIYQLPAGPEKRLQTRNHVIVDSVPGDVAVTWQDENWGVHVESWKGSSARAIGPCEELGVAENGQLMGTRQIRTVVYGFLSVWPELPDCQEPN